MNCLAWVRRCAAGLASVAGAACLAGAFASAVHALDDSARCEARTEELTGKYFKCLQNAEESFTRRGDVAGLSADRQDCRDKFDRVMARIVAQAGGACPSGLSPEEYRDFLDECSAGVTAAAETGAAASCGSCGDGVVDAGEQCDGVDLAGASCAGLGYTLGGELSCDSFCSFDRSGCRSQWVPATGESVSYGAESDGAVRAGAPLSYVDNGDGTITDLNTGLMWEKKDDGGGTHDKDNEYEWSSTFDGSLDGTVVSDFLDVLNDVAGGGVDCFAGHCDWRLPNVKEIVSIFDFGRLPAIDPVFSQPTCTGCADATLASCSCNADSYYLTSTTDVERRREILAAKFDLAFVGPVPKNALFCARAVRSW